MEKEKKIEDMTVREYLSRTNDARFEEELTRPRIEIWPDEWAAWVSSHREDKKDLLYCYTEAKASPLCPIGIH